MSQTPNIPLKVVRQMIRSGKYRINGNAVESAYSDFSWEIDDVGQALCALKFKHFHKSEIHRTIPDCVMDYYKAPSLYQGESVYTHFYLRNDLLIISSFKELES